jgi:hypothetical protein
MYITNIIDVHNKYVLIFPALTPYDGNIMPSSKSLFSMVCRAAVRACQRRPIASGLSVFAGLHLFQFVGVWANNPSDAFNLSAALFYFFDDAEYADYRFFACGHFSFFTPAAISVVAVLLVRELAAVRRDVKEAHK